jgi:hypothetical protein
VATTTAHFNSFHAFLGSLDFALNKFSCAAEVAAAATRRHKVSDAAGIRPSGRVHTGEKFLSKSLHLNEAQTDDGCPAVPLKLELIQTNT